MKTVDDTDDDAAVDVDDTHKNSRTQQCVYYTLRLNLDKASIHTPLKAAAHTHVYGTCVVYTYNQGRQRRRRRSIQGIAFNMFRSNTKMCFALLCVTFTCVIYWSYKFAHNDKYAGGPKDGYEWIWWQWAR